MGEIADLILEGFFDEETGEMIDGEAPGYPRRLSDLQFSEGASRAPRNTRCPVCKKKYRGTTGLAAHRIALKH